MRTINFSKTAKGNKGFTLAELLVAILILVIVLDLGYVFLFRTHNTFVVGETNSNVQNNVRLAGNMISNQLRYATEAAILPAKPSSFDDSYNYIYLENHKIMLKQGAQTAVSIPANISSDADFDLAFSSKTGMPSVLSFNVSAKATGGGDFDVNTDINVLNINSIDTSNMSSSGTNTCIKYKGRVSLSIWTNALNPANVNVPYTYSFNVYGGKSPYTFAVTSGYVPTGLSVGSSGTLSGTPLTAGDYTFGVTVTDADGISSGKQFALHVDA